MLVNWLYKQEDWNNQKRKLEKGELLDDDLPTHIRRFKLIAMYMGLKPEDVETKMSFIRSIPGMSMNEVYTREGTFRTFHEIEKVALQSKLQFDRFNQMKTEILTKLKTELSAETASAVTAGRDSRRPMN